MPLPEKTTEGLKQWAKDRKTKTIEESIAGKGKITDPKALAVWIRKQALGPEEFKAHQKKSK